MLALKEWRRFEAYENQNVNKFSGGSLWSKRSRVYVLMKITMRRICSPPTSPLLLTIHRSSLRAYIAPTLAYNYHQLCQGTFVTYNVRHAVIRYKDHPVASFQLA